MADRDDMVTVWDGKHLREATQTEADAGARAGTLQYFEEHGIWSPFGSMLYPNQFPFVVVGDGTPTLNLVDPQTGKKGTQFKVEGTNFNDNSAVYFDTRALQTDFISTTELNVYIPKNMTTGIKSVVVKNLTGSPSAQMAFEVVA